MKVLIGFEVHQQLMTNQKLFCECPTNYQDVAPNTNICPICTGMPGSKPLPPNEQATNSAIEIALMLDCKVIANQPIFIQRKHYDYPDLPNGYQRTSLPIAKDGFLEGVRIREVHLEEDPGQYDPTAGVVDFNRCGVPLVEIVTEPDMHSPEEARKFLRRLVRVLEYSGKVRPEAGGAMRVDTNISIEGGGRVEVKNINSVKGAYRAIKFELIRQKSKLERGEQVIRETRAFLESQKITVPMRVKELEEDYRYIPDPDIYPIIIDQSQIERIRAKMVEAPHIREKRLMEQYGIGMESASVIASERELADLFEAVASEVDPKFAATWFRTKLKKVLNYMKIRAAEIKFTKMQLVDLLKMITNKEITPEQGEIVLRIMAKKPEDPRKLISRLKIVPLSEKEIESAINEAINENKKAVEDYLKGREEALNFLAGNVMKITGGKADPREIIKKLRKRLDLIQRGESPK
ncbi:MAG: glutamyl-tRNA amidotransferase [Hadesarchaea archaeon YNP_N21]|jgi:aspartyl-tRNA(Asn)/glutamyl-tRNA(Gln) amidotransferase subunit B|nr:MAG: glutamyl-tRNA amidotransferase [Hadesarchaea archaeon YNP_N21]